MIERILHALPVGFGKVTTNFDKLDLDATGRTGVVIPSYGRPRYVRAFLKSLAKSDLENTVLCFIDESEADIVFDQYSGYRVLKYLDSPGNDLNSFPGDIQRGLDAVKKQCDENQNCLGFNIRLMKGTFFCLRPSAVQHIGKNGLWSGDAWDVALNIDE